MNSDKFDRVVLDLLYGELDELTAAAAKRHMEQSARAREIYAHLEATRKLSVLPVHAPPDNFEALVLERAQNTLLELPLRHRVGRIVSMLAGYAMRPQLIMGALLLLMIGSSLILVRVRPGQHSAVQVTERGAPESDVDLVLPLTPAAPAVAASPPEAVGERASPSPFVPGPSPAAVASEPAPAQAPSPPADAGAEGLDPFDQAVLAYRAGRYGEAQRRFERISRTGGRRAAEAALYAAQATRNVSGCAPAVSRFERVGLRFPGSGPAHEASFRAAKCLRQLGDVEAARQAYEALLQVPSHAERARRALQAIGSAERAAAHAPASAPALGTAPSPQVAESAPDKELSAAADDAVAETNPAVAETSPASDLAPEVAPPPGNGDAGGELAPAH